MKKYIFWGGVGLAAIGGVLFAVILNKPQQMAISGIVVPHHNIVQAEREKLFADVAAQIPRPPTVILIAPNHYESGRAAIQTTLHTWQLSTGDIFPNEGVIKKLITAGIAREETSSFANEHGIKLILGDIKHFFPHARIVPLIFKMNTPQASVQALSKTLYKECRQCLMIASVDFSHYQPAALADLHDRLTLRALENLDQKLLLEKAEVDSPPALALFTLWANLHDTQNFYLANHTNSGIILKNPNEPTTSHFFGWYEKGRSQPTEKSRTFLFIIKDSAVPLNLDERTLWGTDFIQEFNAKEPPTLLAGYINTQGLEIFTLPLTLENGALVLKKAPARNLIYFSF